MCWEPSVVMFRKLLIVFAGVCVCSYGTNDWFRHDRYLTTHPHAITSLFLLYQLQVHWRKIRMFRS